MDFQQLIEEAPAVVSIVAAIGLVFLLPLFLSQRRDIERLRAWMEREPEHPAADLAASEALLDRAEAELEELLGPRRPAGEPATEVRPAGAEAGLASAATRVTHERPALERITMERAALAPHPRWRRFTARATQPRVLIVVGILALALGLAGIFVTQEFLSDGDGGTPGGGRIDRADVTVTVLNGTAVPGLAQTVATEVESNGYPLRDIVGVADPGFENTVVMYEDGQKPAAQKVAGDLGLNPSRVEPYDRDTRLLSGGSDVIVIAGEDRVQR
ncbi:MAG TPA: LytR C-terminal domain-containing protein [Solirubrobacterales bacterium]|nr:LytR C-terminal domain-containing protein [Solirubrobacterales bacterium]